MDVVHYTDEEGYEFKEIIYKDYDRLLQLKQEYESKGAKTWLAPFDKVAGTWVLTIREEKQ